MRGLATFAAVVALGGSLAKIASDASVASFNAFLLGMTYMIGAALVVNGRKAAA